MFDGALFHTALCDTALFNTALTDTILFAAALTDAVLFDTASFDAALLDTALTDTILFGTTLMMLLCLTLLHSILLCFTLLCCMLLCMDATLFQSQHSMTHCLVGCKPVMVYRPVLDPLAPSEKQVRGLHLNNSESEPVKLCICWLKTLKLLKRWSASVALSVAFPFLVEPCIYLMFLLSLWCIGSTCTRQWCHQNTNAHLCSAASSIEGKATRERRL